MHVAVVGAGALGRVFGVRLAVRGGVAVDFVVRGAALHAGSLEIEQVGGERLRLDDVSRSAVVPSHADVVLMCVRADQLDEALLLTLRHGPAVPVVVMTPMLPKTFARIDAALSGRLVAAMPSVAGYVSSSGVVWHWVSRSNKTLLEEPRSADGALSALLAALGQSGIEARFELALHERSAATAMAVLPLFLAIDAAGSIDTLLEDGPLLETTFRALKEGRLLAERCGEIASWARSLDRYLGPFTARVGVALARRRSPELVAFVERRFGRDGHAQNLLFGAEMAALAEEKGTPADSLRALVGRLSG